jgi:hypothetical protein
MNSIMHDVWYHQYGFDEASEISNNNYGRGGKEMTMLMLMLKTGH